jgi:urease accessory protein
MHPLTSVDHLLGKVGVCILGTQWGQPAIWLLPVVFPIVMAFGGR